MSPLDAVNDGGGWRTTACHCGAVRITVPWRPASLTTCNCSICSRYGAIWAYFPQREVAVESVPEATSTYRWGGRTLAFHHCRNCGCVTHYTTRGHAPDRLFALNARVMWPGLLDDVPIRRFDGAVAWKYLDP